MSLMTAQQAKKLSEVHKKPTPDVLERINNLVKNAILNECSEIHLDFQEYGHGYDDVEWLKEYGYSIIRNGACLWWEVSW